MDAKSKSNLTTGTPYPPFPSRVAPYDLWDMFTRDYPHHTPEDWAEGDLGNRIMEHDEWVLTRLPLSALQLNEWGLDQELVDENKEMFEAGMAYPPILYDPQYSTLIDGTHRANALAQLGESEIWAYVPDIGEALTTGNVYQEESRSTFTHDGKRYSVNRVLESVGDGPIVQIPTSELSWILKYATPQAGRVRSADIKAPVLVHNLKGRLVVVDGLHRLAYAVQNDIASLPARMVSDADLQRGLTTGRPRTGTVAQPPYYEGLKEYLESPPATVLPQFGYTRHLTPCNPPEDPDWPTPTDFGSARQLMSRLPHRAQVVCALVAAEAVLPIWASAYPEDHRPQEAILTSYEWLEGRANKQRVDEVKRAAYAAQISTRGSAGIGVMEVAFAAHAAINSIRQPRGEAVSAVVGAAYVADRVNWITQEEFYAWWWRECRCRLAIGDVEEAELTTWSPPTVAQPPVSPYAFTPPHEGRGVQYDPTRYYERYGQPCNPPEDPEWPTPEEYEDVRRLMRRLPQKQRVICALVAAELVLPIWEASYPDDHRPEEAIRTGYEWLDGQATRQRVDEVLRAASAATASTYNQAVQDMGPHHAAAAAQVPVGIILQPSSSGDLAPLNGAYAAERAERMTLREFYELWWRECRCRLALVDVGEAEMLTAGQPPVGPHAFTPPHEGRGIEHDPTRYYERYYQPCDPPDDPRWPAPKTKAQAFALIKGLPKRARSLAGATAVELVLPIFESINPGDTRPRRAVEAVYAWANGEITPSERQEIGEEIGSRYDFGDDPFVARLIGYAAWSATASPSPRRVIEAIWGPAVAARAEDWMSEEEFLDWWWKEVRCRLPFLEGPGTRPPTGTVAQPPTRPHEGRGIEHDPTRYYERSFQPCNPPEDPRWPTPTTSERVAQYIQRLPFRQQIIAGFVAAELVLPIYDYPTNNLPQPESSHPHGAVEAIRQWLAGEGPDGPQIREDAEWGVLWAAQEAALVTDSDSELARASAAFSILNALQALRSAETTNASVYTAVREAAEAMRWAGRMTVEEFFELWWKEVRCRIPLLDAPTAELTTGHPTDTVGQPPVDPYAFTLPGEGPGVQYDPTRYYERYGIPCDPPDDPRWPAPRDDDDVRKILEKLPHKAQTICALVAAELVRPIFDESSPGDNRVRRAILVVSSNLKGEAGIDEVQLARQESADAGNTSAGPVAHAAYSASDAAQTAWSAPRYTIVPATFAVTWAASAAFGANWMSREAFYVWWWKECRCRLALEDAPTAELTTGQPSPGEYEEFKAGLEAPPTTVLPQQGYERYLTPCDPPDDPEWPTPIDHGGIRALMGRLPRKQQVLCALIASELVLHLFEAQYPDEDRPRRAIETTYEWLDEHSIETADRYTLSAARGAAYEAGRIAYVEYHASYPEGEAPDYGPGAAPFMVAFAVSNAVQGVSGEGAYTIPVAITQAATAANAAGWMTFSSFLDLWWKECRCRLALEDVSTAELTTGSISDPFSGPKTQLEGTERQVVPVHDWLRFQQPCDPPEDPNWPTPTTYNQVQAYLQRLPLKQQVVAALAAAELVLHLYTPDGTPSPRGPYNGTQAIRRWLAGEISTDQIQEYVVETGEMAGRAQAVAQVTHSTQAERTTVEAAYAADHATMAVNPELQGFGGDSSHFPSFMAVMTATDAMLAAGEMSEEEFYELWWKEVRCRIPLLDAPTAELTTGQPSPEEYEQFKARLEDPIPTVLPQYSYERHFTPCDPPEDPDWPTPTNFNSIRSLMTRLPHKQQVICGLIAAKKVLPIYEEAYPDDTSARTAIETADRWLAGQADVVDVMEATNTLYQTYMSYGSTYERQGAAYQAASAAYMATRVVGDTPSHSTYSSSAALDAAMASQGAWQVPTEAFLDWWWRECRCALPFADAARRDLRAPVDYRGLRVLLEGLPDKDQAIAALIAAEMALPIFERAFPDKTGPKEALEAIHMWLDGKLPEVSAWEVQVEGAVPFEKIAFIISKARQDWRDSFREDARAASDAAKAAEEAAEAAYAAATGWVIYDLSGHATAAVAAAADAFFLGTGEEMLPREEFYRLWWEECLRQLSFFKTPGAEIVSTVGLAPISFGGPEKYTSYVEQIIDLPNCNIADDPSLPAPKTIEGLYEAVDDLDSRAKLLGAGLIAAMLNWGIGVPEGDIILHVFVKNLRDPNYMGAEPTEMITKRVDEMQSMLGPTHKTNPSFDDLGLLVFINLGKALIATDQASQDKYAARSIQSAALTAYREEMLETVLGFWWRYLRCGMGWTSAQGGWGDFETIGARKEPLRIATGVVERDGKYLIADRIPPSDWPGYWEFPGGKIDPGETSEEAAVREVKEEVGVDVQVRASLGAFVLEDYSVHGDIHGEAFLLGIIGDEEPRPIAGENVKWATLDEISEMEKVLPSVPKIVEAVRRYNAGTTGQPPVGPHAFTPPHEGHGIEHDPTRYYERYYQPCDPPEDPNWPTPQTRDDVEALLDRLPPNQLVICALTAAELVLPIFESEYPGNERLRPAIEAIYRWLNGQRDDPVALGSLIAFTAQDAADDAERDGNFAAQEAALAARAAFETSETSETSEARDTGHDVETVDHAADAAQRANWMTEAEFYAWWWKECRCRLAFTDVEGAELLTTGHPTGTVAQPPHYAPLKEYLDAPPATVLPQHSYERHLTPCDPPEDPNWPTPTDFLSTEALMDRLPHKQQIICALTAAEMVLPIFEEAYPENNAPAAAIAITYSWLESRADDADVFAASQDAFEIAYTAFVTAAGQGSAPSATNAAYSSAHASIATYAGIGADYSTATKAAQAAQRAAMAASAAQWMTRTEFYELWWRECRCRLPFKDVGETELLTTGRPTGTVAQPPYYGPLKEYLEAPPATVLPEYSYSRHLTPCDPPEDPNWPAPTEVEGVRALLDRLPQKQQILCALTAAELVLPIYMSAFADDSRPQDAIRLTYMWLEGEATEEAVRFEVEQTAMAARARQPGHGGFGGAYDSAIAANLAALSSISARRRATHEPSTISYATSAVFYAAHAAASPVPSRPRWMTMEEFYALWWKECRCKLAFTDVEGAELLTTGEPPLKRRKRPKPL